MKQQNLEVMRAIILEKGESLSDYAFEYGDAAYYALYGELMEMYIENGEPKERRAENLSPAEGRYIWQRLAGKAGYEEDPFSLVYDRMAEHAKMIKQAHWDWDQPDRFDPREIYYDLMFGGWLDDRDNDYAPPESG